MNTTVFDPETTQFCETYLIANRPMSPADVEEFEPRRKAMIGGLFEQFMLFDRVALKVQGENIPAALLLNQLGQKGLEALIEQGAIRFDHWTIAVMVLESLVPNVNPLAHGEYSSPAQKDPEASVDLGLNWCRAAPVGRQRRKLVQKCADLYVKPDRELATRAVDAAYEAYSAGKLSSAGLSPEKPLDQLDLPARRTLAKCAGEYADFIYLAQRQMTSYRSFPLFALFSEAGRVRSAQPLAAGFEDLRVIEGVPNLAELHARLPQGFRDVVHLRNGRNAAAFRNWLATTVDGEDGAEVVRAYVDAIAKRKGLFDSPGGKAFKSIAMSVFGLGVGAVVSGPAGAAVGGVAGALLPPATDVGLGLADAFLLDGAAKGWTPRLFFDDLKRVKLLPPVAAEPG